MVYKEMLCLSEAKADIRDRDLWIPLPSGPDQRSLQTVILWQILHSNTHIHFLCFHLLHNTPQTLTDISIWKATSLVIWLQRYLPNQPATDNRNDRAFQLLVVSLTSVSQHPWRLPTEPRIVVQTGPKFHLDSECRSREKMRWMAMEQEVL